MTFEGAMARGDESAPPVEPGIRIMDGAGLAASVSSRPTDFRTRCPTGPDRPRTRVPAARAVTMPEVMSRARRRLGVGDLRY
jgi:hypothetical protein